jgi:hypothetical protein
MLRTPSRDGVVILKKRNKINIAGSPQPLRVDRSLGSEPHVQYGCRRQPSKTCPDHRELQAAGTGFSLLRQRLLQLLRLRPRSCLRSPKSLWFAASLPHSGDRNRLLLGRLVFATKELTTLRRAGVSAPVRRRAIQRCNCTSHALPHARSTENWCFETLSIFHRKEYRKIESYYQGTRLRSDAPCNFGQRTPPRRTILLRCPTSVWPAAHLPNLPTTSVAKTPMVQMLLHRDVNALHLLDILEDSSASCQ